MPLAITCACGARLEIDDRFAGQVIPCPDCQTPLHLPELAPVRHCRVSGLAITSLMVSLIGGLTIVGAVAGMLLGYMARRRISRYPEQLTGASYARAALLVGAAGLTLSAVAMAAPDVLHLGALWREFRFARSLDYTPLGAVPPEVTKSVLGERVVSIVVPSRRWGLWQPKRSSDPSDHLILIDAWNDAQIACQSVELSGDEADNWESARGAGLKKLVNSELLLTLLRPRQPALDVPTPRDQKQRNDGSQEMVVDLRAGVERTFLVRMLKKDNRLFLAVGTTRAHRFARMQDELKKAIDSFQVKQ
jgi:hypothetical protein